MITIGEAHVDDVGTEVRLNVTDGGVPVDLTGATELTIRLRKPSGAIVDKPAFLVGPATDGVINCYTAAGDLDEAGIYFVQARIVLAAWSGHSEKRQLRVHENVD